MLYIQNNFNILQLFFWVYMQCNVIGYDGKPKLLEVASTLLFATEMIVFEEFKYLHCIIFGIKVKKEAKSK